MIFYWFQIDEKYVPHDALRVLLEWASFSLDVQYNTAHPTVFLEF
jgi:hypothetical protein